MAFSRGFEKVAAQEKEAFVGLLARGAMSLARPLAGAAAKAGGSVVRGANKVLGGTLGTVMTGYQAAGDYKKYKGMMDNAAQR